MPRAKKGEATQWVPEEQRDWKAIREAFETGMSLNNLQAYFRVHKSTIKKRADREGWERSLKSQVAEKAQELFLTDDERACDSNADKRGEVFDEGGEENSAFPHASSRAHASNSSQGGKLDLNDLPPEERENARQTLQMMGLDPDTPADQQKPRALLPQEGFGLQNEDERKAALADMAARQANAVIKTHRKELGRLALSARELLARYQYWMATGDDGGRPLLGEKESPAQALERITNIHSKLISLERQAFQIDEMADNIEPIVPYVDKRGSPMLDITPSKAAGAQEGDDDEEKGA